MHFTDEKAEVRGVLEVHTASKDNRSWFLPLSLPACQEKQNPQTSSTFILEIAREKKFTEVHKSYTFL